MRVGSKNIKWLAFKTPDLVFESNAITAKSPKTRKELRNWLC